MRLVSKGNGNGARSNSAGRNPAAGRINSAPGARTPTARASSERNNKNNEKPTINETAVRPEVRPEKKKSHIKTAVIIVMIFIIGFAALFVSLGFYVDSLDTVFPNVWADGINVSGLTFDEAKQTLIDEGYESNADGITMTLVFPDASRFSVTGVEVGLSLDAGEAAKAAFAFGRDDTFFRNEITYIRSIFNRTDLTDLSTPDFDDSIVRELSAEYTLQFNKTLMDSNLERTNEGITIVIGTDYSQASENDVFNLAISTLLRAVEEHGNLTVNYIPDPTSEEGIDLNLLFESIHIDPVTSVWDVETLSATVSSEGRTFDLDTAEEKLRNAESGQTIFIPIYTLYPDYTKEDIESMIFRDVLAESTSTMTNIANRIRNITLAAEFINGTVLNPGEVFSFNEVVGQRTQQRGFLEANGIVGGRLTPVWGGGICQASSTIYDAILRTQLEVVERRAHGLTVSYLPYGQDATVAYGNLDFKFKNNTDFPLRLETTISGRNITAKLIGTNRDGSYTEIEMGEPVITPFIITERHTDELYEGDREVWTPGQNGVRVVTYRRHFTAEGELISVQEITSTYRTQNREILIGTAVRPPPPPPPPPDTGHQEPPPPDTGHHEPPSGDGGQEPPPDGGGGSDEG